MGQDSVFTESLRLLLPSDPLLKVQALKLTSLDQFITNFSQGQVLTGTILERLSSSKALVDFNGHRVAVDLGQKSISGQTFQARVEQLTPSPVLKILSNRDSTPVPPGTTAKPDSAQAPPGDVVRFSNLPQSATARSQLLTQSDLSRLGLNFGDQITAKVVSSNPNGTLRVLIKGQETTIFNEPSKGVPPGSLISIEVRKSGEGFVLTSLSPPERKTPVELLRGLLPQRQSLDKLIQELQSQIQRYEGQGNKIPAEIKIRLEESLQLFRDSGAETRSSADLKNTVERSGISYEAKIKSLLEPSGNPMARKELMQDFKGQLQELAKHLETLPGTGGKSAGEASQALGKHINATLQNIEIHQLSHFIARQENQPLALLIPNVLDNNHGQFKVFYLDGEDSEAGKEGKGKSGFNLVFLLDMSRLGKMRVDARVKDSQVDLHVFVESKEVLDFIQSGFALLLGQLGELGFEGNIKGQTDPSKIEKLDQENSLSPLKNINSLIDIRT